MNLLYIIDKLHQHAGMERILSSKMNYLSRLPGWRVSLATYEQKCRPLPFPLDAAVQHYPLEVPIATREGFSFLPWVMAYRKSRKGLAQRLRRLLEELQPDVVVVTVYSFSVLDVIISESRRTGARVVLESHTESSTVLMAHKYGYNRPLHLLMQYWDRHLLQSVRQLSLVVCLTAEDTRFWQPYLRDVRVIPNMVSTLRHSEVDDTSQDSRVDYTSQRVIAVGRYSHEKGYDLLMEAWARVAPQCPGWQLHLYGDGDRCPVEAQARSLGVADSVHAHEAVKDIASVYASCSLCVVSSRYEGFSLVLAEAMSCGLPAVAFDCPYGPRHILQDGENGYLVPLGDTEALAQRMVTLMHDSVLRERMGKSAEESIRRRFSVEEVMTQWERVFNELKSHPT